MRRLTVSVHSIIFNTVLFCVYILPVYEFEKMGFTLDKYLFLLVVLIIYIYTVLKECKISLFEVSLILFSVFFSCYRRDISFIHIISIALMYKLLKRQEIQLYIKNIVSKSMFVYVCLLAVVFYSILYFGNDGRYVHSSIEDPNMTGLAIFLLFVMIYSKNRIVGRILLVVGLLTFSKSYLVAVALFIFINFLNYKHIELRINYALLSLISIIVLVFLSSIFIELGNVGNLQQYGTGINRFLVLFDYSNYFRFTVNTNVIHIYINDPRFLLTGISNVDFFKLNAQYCKANNLFFFRIKPHNFFFSYFLSYGIWSIPIFCYTYKIFKFVITKLNNHIALSIFFYLIFLGIGATNYWLYLSVFALIVSMDSFQYDEGIFIGELK